MSEINLEFNLSNVVNTFELNPVSANIQQTAIDLNLTTGPLAITVNGTGAFYTGAINNNPIAYTASNVVVQIPSITIQAEAGSFAVAEYNVVGTTENVEGTPATANITFTGSTPVQGNVGTNASATFSVSGLTPEEFNNDATAANAVVTFTGTSSLNTGGTDTIYNIDALSTFAAGTGTNWTVIIPAYGQYLQTTVPVSFSSGDNATVALNKVQTAISNVRSTMAFSTTPSIAGNTLSNSIYASAPNVPINYNSFISTAVGTNGIDNIAVFSANTSASQRLYSNIDGGSTLTSITSNLLIGVLDNRFSPTKVIYNGARWVVPYDRVVSGFGNTQRYVSSSTDGTSWSSTLVSESLYSQGSLYGAQIYYLGSPPVAYTFGTRTSNAWATIYSGDSQAINWTPAFTIIKTTPDNKAFHAMAYGNSTYVVFYGDTSSTAYSGSTVAGLTYRTPVGAVIVDCVWSGTNFVAVGEAGFVVTSSNGSSWTDRTSNVSFNLLSVASNGFGAVVAVGNGGTIIYSGDNGLTWSTVTSPTTASFTSIVNTSETSFLVSTSNGAQYTLTLPTYRRLTIDTNYGVTNGNITVSYVAGTGTDVSTRFSTINGTAGTQAYDQISLSDGTNGQVFQIGYNLTAEQITSDIISRANIVNWTVAPSTSTSILTTRNTAGLITLAQQMTPTYTRGFGGNTGTGNAQRTSSYLGSSATQRPQPQMTFTLDAGNQTISLPYNTNIATITDWSTRFMPTGWTVTQTMAGSFTLTHNFTGAVANIAVNFTDAGTSSATRTAYNDGSGTVPDPNQPYIELTFAEGYGFSPNPYRLYLPWNSSAAALADTMRVAGSVSGVAFGGTANTNVVTLQYTPTGVIGAPTITEGGTGDANWGAVSAIEIPGTGGTASFITIDGIMYPIGSLRNPSQAITDLITNFYSDTWRIHRSGTNQFSLVPIQIGPTIEPVVSTTSTTQTVTLESFTDGTNISGTIPTYGINLGQIGVVLPGITFIQ